MDFEVDDKTLFGKCRWCEGWVPRDVMISVNIRVYGKGVDVTDDIIRHRICPSCFGEEIPKLKSKEWSNEMYRTEEIRKRRSLADRCELVDYEP